MYHRIKRRPKWVDLLGLRESTNRAKNCWRQGLTTIFVLGLALTLYYSDSSSKTIEHRSGLHGASRRLLETTPNSTAAAAGHGPEWERCDFELYKGVDSNGFPLTDSNGEPIPNPAKFAWVFNHFFFILVIFVALAIICDDFFVPSLEVISEKLKLSEDVAGATFMAAGSSAPELFSSVAGVAVQSDVGIGTIVGSAVFNLLIIIALTAALAGQVLTLDWRPLARDSFFYAMSIGCFIGFAWDGLFTHYESVILLVLYGLYIVLMVFNPRLMEWMGTWKWCCSKKVEPVEDGKEKNQETVLNGSTTKIKDGDERKQAPLEEEEEEEEEETMNICPCLPCCPRIRTGPPKSPEEGSKCVEWAKYVLKWMLYIPAFPWVIAFSWTIPDCSKEHNKKWYIASFLLSVLWIALLSFGMVTLVGRAGCILGIDAYIMGLVVVAIGTSVPDALSSVLVARDGFGDMAVSNAIGSNVFDINLGLGLPFLIRIAIDAGKPIELLDDIEVVDFAIGKMALVPHVKFGFILLLILVIALFLFGIVKFRLNKWIGISFVCMYVIFIVYAFIQELYCVRVLGLYC